MNTAPQTILGISTGVQFTGFAVLRSGKLVSYKTSHYKGKWSKTKLKIILLSIKKMIARYSVSVVRMKIPHYTHSSTELDILISETMKLCKKLGIEICAYPLIDLKKHYGLHDWDNKITLAEKVTEKHFFLLPRLDKYKKSQNDSNEKLFEAVAVVSVES